MALNALLFLARALISRALFASDLSIPVPEALLSQNIVFTHSLTASLRRLYHEWFTRNGTLTRTHPNAFTMNGFLGMVLSATDYNGRTALPRRLQGERDESRRRL